VSRLKNIDERIREAKRVAPMQYEFYRGYLKGLADALGGGNLEDIHPVVDMMIDHAVASLICEIYWLAKYSGDVDES